MKYALVLGLLVLAACTTPIKMRNPATGAVAQCGPYRYSGLQAQASAFREAQCIRDYKEQGYVRQ